MSSTLTVCFDLFSRDTIRIQSRMVQVTCFSRSSSNKASSEFMRLSSARLCTFPWASRRPQQLLTRSSILSMAPINSGSFTRDGDKISLKRLRARPAVYGSHLQCNLRQLSKLWSPPADITTSELSPSVRADSTPKSCPSISLDSPAFEYRHTERDCCRCDHVLRFHCKR